MLGQTGNGKCQTSATVARMGTLSYTPPGRAIHSDTADNATNAARAANSDNADNATNAGYADNAGQLGGHSQAWIRGNGTYSSDSGHASSADNATNANRAGAADTADNAANATHASSADYASTAGSAGSSSQRTGDWCGWYYTGGANILCNGVNLLTSGCPSGYSLVSFNQNGNNGGPLGDGSNNLSCVKN